MPSATTAPTRRDEVGTAVLEAAIRLLMAEFGDPVNAAPERGVHLFSFLSASAVTRAATRLGPLRVTTGHLRDRWPTQVAYAEDLLSYGLHEHHRTQRLGPPLGGAGAPEPDDVDGVLDALAADVVQRAEQPVLTRLRLLACVLADRRPELRAALVVSMAEADTAWDAWARGPMAAQRMRTRDGVRLEDWTRSLQALADGVRLRLLGTDAGTADEQQATVDLLARGMRALTRACTEPDPAPATPARTPAAPRRPMRSPSDLSGVLHRLVDPGSSTRRTERARRRLANDPVTVQLLDGGLAVLAGEFEPAGAAADRPSRFFDVLSVAALVRESAHEPLVGINEHAVRSRWAHHDDLVDDLVDFALSAAHGVFAAERAAHLDEALPRGADLLDIVRRAGWEQVEECLGATAYRVRVVAATLARTRPLVQRMLADGHARQTGAWADLYDHLLPTTGRRWVAGVGAQDVAQLRAALTDGVVQRAMAVGEGAVLDRGTMDSLLARAELLLLRGSSEPAG